MIIESKIESLKEEKVNLKEETVESTNPYLPKIYFYGMWIGAKGTGKTCNLVSLLKHYENSQILDRKHTMCTILFCPTGNSDFNKIYTTLESLDQEKDVILEYTDELSLSVLDDIKNEEDEIKNITNIKKHIINLNQMKN